MDEKYMKFPLEKLKFPKITFGGAIYRGVPSSRVYGSYYIAGSKSYNSGNITILELRMIISFYTDF